VVHEARARSKPERYCALRVARSSMSKAEQGPLQRGGHDQRDQGRGGGPLAWRTSVQQIVIMTKRRGREPTSGASASVPVPEYAGVDRSWLRVHQPPLFKVTYNGAAAFHVYNEPQLREIANRLRGEWQRRHPVASKASGENEPGPALGHDGPSAPLLSCR